MTRQQTEIVRNEVAQAIGTGVRPNTFDSSLTPYLLPARAASEDGYSAAFLAVSVLCLVALVLIIRLIRKPPRAPELAEVTPAESHAEAAHADAPMPSRRDAELAPSVQQESAATAPPEEGPTVGRVSGEP
jgi:hypothetical protein